jgi:penicillin-binding protein 2A
MNDFHQNQPTLSRKQRLSRKKNGNKKDGNGVRDFFGGFKLFFKWFFIGSIVVGVVLGCWAAYIYATTEEYSLDALKKIQYSSVVLDANNKEIGRLTVEGGDDRELVTVETLKKTNPLLLDTIKKVEDVRFDEHDGVDYYALGRAVFKNIVAMGKAEGGGTITMQVARNIILNSKEKSYTRKIREFAIAQNLGKKYSKDQILEAYLNYINFHPTIRGVGLAAKVYFNKDLNKDTLTPGEVAILAGLPKSPSMYNPISQNIKTRKRSEERRNTVLGIMAREEDEMGALITAEEAGKYREKRIEEQAQYHKEHLREKGSAYLQLVKNELELLESQGELSDNSISAWFND